MENQLTQPRSAAAKNTLLLIGIIFVSFNLRAAITSVGPLISFIRTDTGISNGMAGMLTTLPLISFAILSIYAPKLGRKLGNEMMVFLGMAALMAGILLRSTGTSIALYTGTAIVGIGIAIANVLLPSIVKDKFSHQVGLVTGAYTSCMGFFAALGSGLSIPLAEGMHLGWQKSLTVWAFLVAAALLIWLPQVRSSSAKKVHKASNHVPSLKNIWRSKIAWQVTLFMGLQSFLFYSTIAWLPEILIRNGLSTSLSGWMLSIMQLASLPLTFFTPVLADRFRSQKGIVVVIGILYLSGVLGLLIRDSLLLTVCSIVLIGFAQGSSISLALTLIGLRAVNAQQAGELSGMAQSIGYFLAAVGPFVIGIIMDVSPTVTIPLLIFGLIILMMVISGIGAGRNETV
ncbi:CynX/NimT family MFS transporter [Peribacillus deserti]|uniref:MFS transporter n=1 Tax=Peribacillus deserti TaxID=673318 RepID=A0A2N5MBC6_9BACI|nr:MFS transporter [Peribacillus deserti]PLT31647.1 MFS transporter [Peribacillus deserti]